MITTRARVTILINMRRTVRRRTPNLLREVGIVLGAALALGSLAIGANVLSDPSGTSIALAIIYLAWAAGWILGPIQTGGGDFLRPEWFAMIPGSRTQLAFGVLAATCTGYGALFTVTVTSSLVVYAAQYSVVAVLVAVPAALILALALIVMSKLVAELLGSAARTRVAVEVTAFNYGLFLALSLSGWVAVWGMLQRISGTHQNLTSLVPEALVTFLQAFPTGWGLVAVQAAADGRWALAFGAVGGLIAVTIVGFLAWCTLLSRRLVGSAATGRRASGTQRPRNLYASTRVGAVLQRDLRSWLRDPRRGIEVRSTLWASAFTVLAMWFLVPEVTPFAGVIVAVLGTIGATNIYAMDGTALWLTLLTPGGERADVRGRQLSWVVVFGSGAVIATVLALAVTGARWAVPTILALLPAAVGGAAGLIPYVGITLLVAETDAHRRTGNPAETGAGAETFGLYWIMTIASTLTIAPPAGVIALALATGRPEFIWLAVPVGLATGLLLARGLGKLAIGHLQRRGPEQLQRMRIGPQRRTHHGARGARPSTGR